jgi:hypothetical protein
MIRRLRARKTRVLSYAECEGLNAAELKSLIAQGWLPPIGGADDGGDAGGDDGGSGDGAGAGAGDGAGDGGDTGASGAAGDDGKGGDGGDDDWKPLTREETEALQRSHAEAQKQIREAAKAQKTAEQKAKEQKGDFENLHKTEKERADRLEKAAVTGSATNLATSIATRLNFRAPSLAHKLIADTVQGVEGEVDPATGKVTLADGASTNIEKALKDLAAAEKDLTTTGEKRPQHAGSGGGGNGTDMNAAIRQAAGRG